MKQFLLNLIPILDHLYIYQLLEYNYIDFIRWFIKHPFARNLQRKKQLVLTKKAVFLLSFILVWEILISAVVSIVALGNILLAPLVLILASQTTPLFLLFVHLSYLPLDFYFKNKILSQAQRRLWSLSKLTVIAITGSYGKTSTKEMLCVLLRNKFNTVKTPKSFNTPLGIAQTIIHELKDTTEVFIAEVGAYQRGEIAKITKLLKPKIAIITAVAPQHLERFGSLENVAYAKFELAENLPGSGIVILNGVNLWLQKLASQSQSKVIFYGRKNDPYYSSGVRLGAYGTSFIFHTPKDKLHITIPLYGWHHVQNFQAAAVAAINLGVDLKTIKERAKFFLPTPHRLEITKQDSLTIIDNTYNTNPNSAMVSLGLLKSYPGKQKIVVTPGMVELGDQAEEENKLFAKKMAEVADEVVIVGTNVKKFLLTGLQEAAFPKRRIHLVATTVEGVNSLPTIAKPDAVVLLENDLPDQYF